MKGDGSPRGRRSLQWFSLRDREQQNRGMGHSRDQVALIGTYSTLPDNGRSILHVSNCKLKMQQILFKTSRVFEHKEDSLFLFISNFLLSSRLPVPQKNGEAQDRGSMEPGP